MTFDPTKDLMPITNVASGPQVVVVHPDFEAKNLRELIVVHPDFEAKNLRELIDLARAKRAVLNYVLGTVPVGNSPGEFAEVIREESARWATVVRERRIVVN